MSPQRFHAVVPAAGVGQRMAGAGRPKQYLPLAGATVLERALAPLLDHPGLDRLVVVLAPGDRTFATLTPAGDRRVVTATGGATRAESVAAGLDALADAGARATDFVLVHDAARPCLARLDIDRLLAACSTTGALLAVPVNDTLKRGDAKGRVEGTVDRSGLWQALTPQAFPLAELRSALAAHGRECTDEAQAMERAGHAVGLVEGHSANLKVTRPGDLQLAETILARWREPT